jgi:uncharacterized membrane protein SpoIIM required for sporulation
MIFSIRLRRHAAEQHWFGRYLLVFLTGGFAGFVLMLVRPLKFSWLFLAPQGLVAIIYFLCNVAVVYDPRLIAGYDPQVSYIPHIIGFVTRLSFGIAWSANWKRSSLITIALLGIYT